MTLIDLGEVTHDAPAPVMPVDVRRVTRTALTLVSVIVVLLTAGATRPGPPLVHPLWTVDLLPTEFVTVAGDHAYLSRHLGGGGSEVAAYDLATGTQRWRHRTGDALARIEPVPGGPVLVSRSRQFEQPTSDGVTFYEYAADTTALDPATGAELWATRGEVDSTAADGTALVTRYDERADGLRPAQVRRVRLADGRDVWNAPVPGGSGWALISPDGRPGTLVTASETGEILMYGYADGVLRATGQVPWRAGRTYIAAVGSYLSVQRGDVPGDRTSVYRLDDLTLLWRTDDATGYVAACGRVICTVDPSGVTGVDPATGRKLWNQRDLNGIRVLSADRLLLTDSMPVGTSRLIDAATGRVLGASFYGVTLVRPSGAPLLGLSGTRADPAVTAIFAVDPATGRRTLLGATSSSDDMPPCQATSRYLVCQRDLQIAVTAVG